MTNIPVEKAFFGRTADGRAVDKFTLRNPQGMRVSIITYGATVTEIWAPDREGKFDDVVLGFDELSQYEVDRAYFGCIVGRTAFRIVGGRFELNGKTYALTINNGCNHAHGGQDGFNKRIWRTEVLAESRAPAVRFSLVSPAGDQGYPGAIQVAVVFTLTDENELQIECSATTDHPTLVNMTHHGYFNLNGEAATSVLDHVLHLAADRWINVENPEVSQDELLPVEATPFDFQKPMSIGSRIREAGPQGYDVCYLCTPSNNGLRRVASLSEPRSGRTLEVSSTEPAIVLYTGGYLNDSVRGKRGVAYAQHAGLCLETGRPPDAVHHPTFPSTLLLPNSRYRHVCAYRFSTIGITAPATMHALLDEP